MSEQAAEKLINFPLGYSQPPEFKNIPFNEAWLTLDGLPFGLEDWAMEFMAPGDYGTGIRVIENTPPHEPIVLTFRVKREHNGDVDIQYDVSKDEWFSLRANGAVLTRRGAEGRGGLTMAKWAPMLTMARDPAERGKRVWMKLWERKIVRENVAPLVPATNGAALEFVRDNVHRLAVHYNVPAAPKDADDLFWFSWEREVLSPDKKVREPMFKDTRLTDVQLMRMVIEFHNFELLLKTNVKDLTKVQLLAEFQGFAFKCKCMLGLQVAQGLSVRSIETGNDPARKAYVDRKEELKQQQ